MKETLVAFEVDLINIQICMCKRSFKRGREFNALIRKYIDLFRKYMISTDSVSSDIDVTVFNSKNKSLINFTISSFMSSLQVI